MPTRRSLFAGAGARRDLALVRLARVGVRWASAYPQNQT